MPKRDITDLSPPQLHRQPGGLQERGTRPAVDFWSVFESAPDAYLLLAPDTPYFTMVAANATRLRVTMTRRDDVVGRPLFEVFPDNPTDPGATGVRNLRASLEHVLQTGRPHRMPLQKYDIRTRDGSFEERYWDLLNTPVFDDQGALIYIIHRVEDVTEQVRSGKKAEETTIQLARETAAHALEAQARKEIEVLLEKLRESETRYRLLADMIPQNIWTTDPSGQHRYFSRRWYDYTGASPEDSFGDGWVRFIHPDDGERMVARWQHSVDTGEPYEIEYRFRSADGDYCWFLGKALPLRDASGHIVEWFGTATDISERKRLEGEREQLYAREQDARADAERQRDELARVTESRARLMRGFSHDVKNPLGAADGWAHLLEQGISGDLPEQARHNIGRIRRSIRHALEVIDSLHELAKTEAGDVPVKAEPVDLCDLTGALAEEYRVTAETAGLSLDIDTSCDVPLIRTDVSRVGQILGNLLSNAIKYTDTGGVTIQPSAPDTGPDADGRAYVRVDVTDTGVGIAIDQQARLFTEFSRISPGNKPGTGLGLAISQRLAQMLGGRITLRSDLGRGSTFSLWLPREASTVEPGVGETQY